MGFLLWEQGLMHFHKRFVVMLAIVIYVPGRLGFAHHGFAAISPNLYFRDGY